MRSTSTESITIGWTVRCGPNLSGHAPSESIEESEAARPARVGQNAVGDEPIYHAGQLLHSTQRTTSNERRATNDEQRTTSNERRATNDEQRTTSNERRATNDEQRTTSNERRATNDEQRTTSNERRATNDEQRTTRCHNAGKNAYEWRGLTC